MTDQPVPAADPVAETEALPVVDDSETAEVNDEQPTESAEPELIERQAYRQNWLWPSVVLILGLGILLILFFRPTGGGTTLSATLPSNSSSTISTSSVQTTTTPPPVETPVVAVAAPSAPEPPGAIPEGVRSWTEYQQKASVANYAALKSMWGYTQKDVAYFASQEKVFGKNYAGKLAPGTSVSNTGFKNGSWYLVKGYHIKNGDVLVLVDDKGRAVIKVSCGNPIKEESRVSAKNPKPNPKPKPKPKPRPKPKPTPCPPANSGPGTTPFKDSPGSQPPDTGGNAGPTPGAGTGTNQGNPGEGTGSTVNEGDPGGF
ncbi:MAG: hypothetical protein WCP14_03050 [bacterium]